MKKLLILCSIAALATGSYTFGQRRLVPDRPNVKAAQQGKARPGAGAATLLGLIQGLYINQLQRQTELTDDQFTKVVPFLRQYLGERNEMDGPRRLRAQNQLNQAINRGAPDEELIPLIQQFDQIDAEVQASQVKFFANADPILSPKQRARLRVYMLQKERQIRRLIQESQNPTPDPPQRTRPSDKNPS